MLAGFFKNSNFWARLAKLHFCLLSERMMGLEFFFFHPKMYCKVMLFRCDCTNTNEAGGGSNRGDSLAKVLGSSLVFVHHLINVIE